MTPSAATEWSVAFFRELIAQGLQHVVVSPGSRSQALALAAVAWEQVEGSPLVVHVVIDERSAGFRALGLALESGRPAVCVSTSGSAPAHYYPAVLEAWHQGVGLIIVSADRPEELHGVGANQTTNQRDLFGNRVPCLMVQAPELGDGAGATEIAREAITRAGGHRPVQVNVSFREPLSSATSLTSRDLPPVVVPELAAPELEALSLDAQPGTLVIAGSGAGPHAQSLAVELGAPLIAEVTSGARFGPHLVPAYREVLSQGELLQSVTRVITLGRPTLSREVWRVLEREDLWHIAIRGAHPDVPNPSKRATIVDELVIEHSASAAQCAQWVKPWVLAGREIHETLVAGIRPPAADLQALESEDQAVRSAFATAEMKVLRQPISRQSVALAVWEATWPHDRLVLGASRMIREIDRVATGKNIVVRANRGLSGIDGTISSALGIADAASRAGASGVTRVVLGDVAFLHDVGSLLEEPGGSSSGRVHLFVAHDGGGTIFDLLEAPEGIPVADRDRVMFTPHSVDIASVAAAYGWEYMHVRNLGDVAEAMSRGDRRLIVELTLSRA